MSSVNIDKGFAWAVPIGGFIANFIVGGLAKSFGIIVSSTQELYNSSTGPLTLAGGLIYTFMYCLSIFTVLLSEKYGCRIIINIGATGCVISFICAYFAPDVITWVIAIGVGAGISLGFIYSPIFVLVGRCFKNKLGVAMGISVAGVSVGQIVFPTIISKVIDAYTTRGAFLIGAGIVCHFFITAALMPRYIVDNTPKPIDINVNGHCKSSKDIELEKLNITKTNEPEIEKVKVRKPKSFSNIHIVMLVMYVFAKIFADVGDVGIAFALPLYGKNELNLEKQTISQSIAVAGGVDLVARIFIGIISDQPWCRHSLLLNAAWFLEAIVAFCFIWFPDIVSYYIFYGIFGLCSGTAITLMTVVLTDLVGQKNMPLSFAIMMFSIGLVIAGGQFLVGHLGDVTGTYVVSMKFLGFNMIAAFIIMCLEYPIKFFAFNTLSGQADEIPKSKAAHMKENKQLLEVIA